LGKSIKGTKITLCGLSYKANIFDLIESPALKIKEILEKEYQTEVKVFEPYSAKDSNFKNMNEVVENSELIIIATNHKEFVEFDFQKNKGSLMAIVDGRNCLDSEKTGGLEYVGVGGRKTKKLSD
jgi:UDP-N-acetyl-D-mannosaminuronic acid dehydrogenase